MFRAIFEGAGDLGVFPTISLVMFLTIFITVLIWMVNIKKPYLNHMSQLPLENNSDQEGKL